MFNYDECLHVRSQSASRAALLMALNKNVSSKGGLANFGFLATSNKPKKAVKDPEMMDLDDNVVSDADDEDTGGPSGAPDSRKLPPDQSSLPPITKVSEMFEDLVSHIPKIQDVAEKLKGRTLRVATMCSGTESPLLALEHICKSIKNQFKIDMRISHVFSCEIEPFKQAYIERNFHPKRLFRDVCELGNEYA